MWYIDVSNLAKTTKTTGIQRVAERISSCLSTLRGSSDVCLIVADGIGGAYVTRDGNHNVNPGHGDVVLFLDLARNQIIDNFAFIMSWRHAGAHCVAVAYDLIPVLLPAAFPEGTAKLHLRWLECICHFDQVLCISSTTRHDLLGCLSTRNASMRLPAIDVWPMGSDLPKDGSEYPATPRVLERRKSPLHFVSVGTIEPRKGIDDILDAFDEVWQQYDIRLTLIGREGWMSEQTCQRIAGHPALGRSLVWEQSLDDDGLARYYRSADCLLLASTMEGYGLPVVEGARYGLPLLLRDIPVFREVAGDHAIYFGSSDTHTLTETLIQILEGHTALQSSHGIEIHNWQKSANALMRLVSAEAVLRQSRIQASSSATLAADDEKILLRSTEFLSYMHSLEERVGLLQRSNIELQSATRELSDVIQQSHENAQRELQRSHENAQRELQRSNEKMQRELDLLRNSTSWRITAPLRESVRASKKAYASLRHATLSLRLHLVHTLLSLSKRNDLRRFVLRLLAHHPGLRLRAVQVVRRLQKHRTHMERAVSNTMNSSRNAQASEAFLSPREQYFRNKLRRPHDAGGSP